MCSRTNKKVRIARYLYRLHFNLEHSRITKTSTALLHIDLEKAFDRVWIAGSLYKLIHYHVNGKMFSLIETFLKNRETIFELSAYRSPAFKVDISVPEGSVLSPLLFVSFRNDFSGRNLVITITLTTVLLCFKAVMNATSLKT